MGETKPLCLKDLRYAAVDTPEGSHDISLLPGPVRCRHEPFTVAEFAEPETSVVGKQLPETAKEPGTITFEIQ